MTMAIFALQYDHDRWFHALFYLMAGSSRLPLFQLIWILADDRDWHDFDGYRPFGHFTALAEASSSAENKTEGVGAMIDQKSIRLLLISLPVCVLAFWLISLEWQLAQAQKIEIAVRGYDPRDLIWGHYLNYELDLGQHNPCAKEQTETALPNDMSRVCWDQSEELFDPYWAGTCGDRPSSCTLFLRGRCQSKRFTAGVERFYIPEADTVFFERMPEGSRLVLRLSKDGRGFVDALKPWGLDYQEWLKQRRQSKK
jgi:hypothetical protein